MIIHNVDFVGNKMKKKLNFHDLSKILFINFASFLASTKKIKRENIKN